MFVANNNRAIMNANFMFTAVEIQYISQTKLFRAFLWNSSVLAAHDWLRAVENSGLKSFHYKTFTHLKTCNQ